MNKLISLIKISLTQDMNIFRINTKKQSKITKILIPLVITGYIMIFFGIYSLKLIKKLEPLNLEYISLTLFALGISFISLIEGIYKSNSILFNCKDDNLLLSLPITRNTVLFTRIFKFYIFELLYNSLFILPTTIVYAVRIKPVWTYYISSFVALLLLPIVPIVLSCIVGFIITYFSSKFKGKNIFQTIFTMLFLLVVIYISYNTDNYINVITKNATSINDVITKLYYPVGAYIKLITEFDIMTLIIYILSHIIVLSITIFILGKVYFKINSGTKKVLRKYTNTNYKIRTTSKAMSFIKKELNRFIDTPVYITNAGFGLVLFVIICILLSIKYNSIITTITKTIPNINVNYINNNIPVLLYGIICFGTLMTSITSSMISLEGKSINILKSLPIKPIKIVLYKVLSALVIMLPCLLIGDLIIFIRFKFNFISIILIIIVTLVMAFVSELIGIICNLKYPKLDATNDTEVVKQSMSSMISVFIGMGLVALTLFGLFKMIEIGLNGTYILLIFIVVYGSISIILYILLSNKYDIIFKNISI